MEKLQTLIGWRYQNADPKNLLRRVFAWLQSTASVHSRAAGTLLKFGAAKKQTRCIAEKQEQRRHKQPFVPMQLFTTVTEWINANGAFVGLLCGLLGFWIGFRSNLYIARRAEWNAVADRIRAELLKSRRYDSIDLRVSDEDIDAVLAQASWLQRRRIQATVESHTQVQSQYEINQAGYVIYTADQKAQMVACREILLELIKRR